MSQITAALSQRQVDRPLDTDTDHAPRGMAELHEGEPAIIVRVCDGADAACARRLFDLGFAPGARVEKIRRAPFGGPAVYRVADYEIALRPSQARTILVDTCLVDTALAGTVLDDTAPLVAAGTSAVRSFAA
ncbi:FeoA family protein [Raineyella fluvialis]|uniref:Ferrous iron transport protein A n=1 Tax=Raineyella fluvialis TaxID=2662261 RepID=A0A5Q2F9M1_9ACTN|nr:FeoA family protein [Raineyella fluvialis]QGF23388.1 ferrous iron transport protein A [Raineyella fluvialis]